MTFDQMALFLETLKGQVRAFDSKAQLLLAVNGLLFGFITAEGAKAAEYEAIGLHLRSICVCVALALAFLSSCVSTLYALFVINPQLQLNQPTSRFFFCHLARDFGQNYQRAAEALSSLADDDGRLDLGAQIQVNALICNVKATRCRRGMGWAGLALLTYAVSVPVFCSMAFSAARHSQEEPAVILRPLVPRPALSVSPQQPHTPLSDHNHP